MQSHGGNIENVPVREAHGQELCYELEGKRRKEERKYNEAFCGQIEAQMKEGKGGKKVMRL